MVVDGACLLHKATIRGQTGTCQSSSLAVWLRRYPHPGHGMARKRAAKIERINSIRSAAVAGSRFLTQAGHPSSSLSQPRLRLCRRAPAAPAGVYLHGIKAETGRERHSRVFRRHSSVTAMEINKSNFKSRARQSSPRPYYPGGSHGGNLYCQTLTNAQFSDCAVLGI